MESRLDEYHGARIVVGPISTSSAQRCRGDVDLNSPEIVPAAELLENQLFRGMSKTYLEKNEGSVVRRRFKKGDIICREGEFGSTAFLIESGTVKVFLQTPMKHITSTTKKTAADWGVLDRIRRYARGLFQQSVNKDAEEAEPVASGDRYIPIDAPIALRSANPVAAFGPGDLFGEMTCMNNYPRSATVQAQEDCTVLEILRNVLVKLQGNKASRDWLEERYRGRSIENHLRTVPIFANLFSDGGQFAEFVDWLRPRVHLKQFNPGDVIFKQGDAADNFYLVRVGFVKVSQKRLGGEQVLTYLGPGGYFGEIGLLTHLPEVADLAGQGVRTATCSALDHVDVVVIAGNDFQEIVARFPALRDDFVRYAVKALKSNEEQRLAAESVSLNQFLREGLMHAQSLLVLDLEKCTRCDECTKACADTHDGVTRLIREGSRFDKFLVTSSCRSCLDPYCMVGCPVGSIRRRNSREIIIEDWCIGCELCAKKCPYGNINMHGFEELQTDPENPDRKRAVLQQKATTCDLCSGLDGTPSCVYACPHDAAHRVTGKELWNIVEKSTQI